MSKTMAAAFANMEKIIPKARSMLQWPTRIERMNVVKRYENL